MDTLQTLQEIANNIKISPSNFYVYHSGYQLSKKITHLVEKSINVSHEVKESLISSLLNDLILNIYGYGIVNLKNDSRTKYHNYDFFDITSEIDWEFYERLNESNKGEGWWNPNYQITKQSADGSLEVKKKNVTICIKRNYHLLPKERAATVGNNVSVYTPKGKIINKYYLIYGNLVSFVEEQNIFIYFNIDPEGMILLIRKLTEDLNQMQIPFGFYALHNPVNYGKNESGYLRVNRDNYKVIKQFIENIYPDIKKYLSLKAPLFTKIIAPGISLAEKPEHEFEFLEGFKANRCKIIAQALLEAHKDGKDHPVVRMNYIHKTFQKFGIDLEHPYLNPNSQDNYPSLSVGAN